MRRVSLPRSVRTFLLNLEHAGNLLLLTVALVTLACFAAAMVAIIWFRSRLPHVPISD